MIPPRTVVPLIAEITGNVVAQPLVQQKNGRTFGSPGIEAGGRIQLGTATSVKVRVVDANGVVLHSAASAVTASVDIPPVPMGVFGPLTVTTTEISNPAHTLTVFWGIKK